LANTKVMLLRMIATNINGRIKRNREMPDDFTATSSKLSPRLPNVMMDEIKMAMGIDKVRSDALAYQRNVMMVEKPRPLPTTSSTYFHKLCINSTKNAMKNVATKGPMNDLSISLSNFFIKCGRCLFIKFEIC